MESITDYDSMGTWVGRGTVCVCENLIPVLLYRKCGMQEHNIFTLLPSNPRLSVFVPVYSYSPMYIYT